MSRPESSRNQYIYPEKQTPTDRLASRLQTSLSEYINPEISDDDYDDVRRATAQAMRHYGIR